jgi:type VI secretion system secreted protein Hcp
MSANVFFKLIPEVKGESMQKGYEGQIEVLSWSWGVSNAAGYGYGSGGGVSKANLQDLSITYRMCPASPKLFESCALGKHYDGALLTMLKAAGEGQEKYLEITLTDVVISSYQTGGSGDDIAIESASFNFAKVKLEYFSQNDQGITKSAGSGQYNQQTGKKE